MNSHRHRPPAPVTATRSSGPSGADEAALLRHAIALAEENASAGQLPFGALVVRDNDPTAHAEIEAIRNACRELRTLELPGATLVSSCEPCALCHAASASAGILRVIYAAPKELAIEILGAPEDPHAALLTEMQRALRALAPEQIVHVPIEGDRKPFERFTTPGPRS